MKRILIVVVLIFICLTGCENKSKEPAGTSVTEGAATPVVLEDDISGYVFTYKGVDIVMGAEANPVVDALGGQPRVFEAPSCAFEGIDRIYYYNGFELYTYPVDGVDYISSVNLMDDNVQTQEGVYLGAALEAMLTAYGNDYSLDNSMYTYTSGDTQLALMTENGSLIQITYYYIH